MMMGNPFSKRQSQRVPRTSVSSLVRAIRHQDCSRAIALVQALPDLAKLWCQRPLTGGYFILDCNEDDEELDLTQPQPQQQSRKKSQHNQDLEKHSCSLMLPLHEALLMPQGPSLELVEILVRAYPKALRKTESLHHRLPLHCAVLSRADPSVIAYLIQKYDLGCFARDNFHKLPVHYAVTCNNNNNNSIPNSRMDQSDYESLHNGHQHDEPPIDPKVVQLLTIATSSCDFGDQGMLLLQQLQNEATTGTQQQQQQIVPSCLLDLRQEEKALPALSLLV